MVLTLIGGEERHCELTKQGGQIYLKPSGKKDRENYILLPGFVDIHIHGYQELTGLDPDGITELSERLASLGVVHFLISLVTMKKEEIKT
ncbi:MAG: hypothetical protein QXL15_01130, partial [Candidatus Korarchaeota archaeon]